MNQNDSEYRHIGYNQRVMVRIYGYDVWIESLFKGVLTTSTSYIALVNNFPNADARDNSRCMHCLTISDYGKLRRSHPRAYNIY